MSSAIDPTSDAWEINVGWAVVTADGKRLGAVEGVHPRHIIVSATHPTSTMLFVPADAVTEIESDRVYLRIAMADALSQGWELTPEIDGMVPDTRPGTVAIGERMQSVVGVFAMAAIFTLATLFLAVSWSVGPVDTAIAFTALLGVAALGVWACLVGYRIGHQ